MLTSLFSAVDGGTATAVPLGGLGGLGLGGLGLGGLGLGSTGDDTDREPQTVGMSWLPPQTGLGGVMAEPPHTRCGAGDFAIGNIQSIIDRLMLNDPNAVRMALHPLLYVRLTRVLRHSTVHRRQPRMSSTN